MKAINSSIFILSKSILFDLIILLFLERISSVPFSQRSKISRNSLACKSDEKIFFSIKLKFCSFNQAITFRHD